MHVIILTYYFLLQLLRFLTNPPYPTPRDLMRVIMELVDDGNYAFPADMFKIPDYFVELIFL